MTKVECRMGVRRIVAAGLAASLILPLPGPAAAQTAAETAAPADMKTFESGELRYTVALPAACRHDQGPGTIDAVCAPDLDAEKSATAAAATALVLGVSAQVVADAGDTSPDGLRQRYSLAAFKEELGEAVCGEADQARVKLENVKEAVEDAHLVYSADVTCAAVKFLQIGERRALVRHVIAPDMHYRLMARAPTEDFTKQRATVDAFFASFRALPAEKAEKTELSDKVDK